MTTVIQDPPIANSPRILTLRHAQNVKEARELTGKPPPPKDPNATRLLLEPIKDGYRNLYPYFTTGLEAKKPEVSVNQNNSIINVKGGEEKLIKEKSKGFTVKTARYSLPEGCIHLFSPAEGGKAPAETLPSIVFGDARMPWEIHVGLAEDDEERENMPWLALLVFSRDELQIASEYLNGLNSILKDTKLEKDAEDAKRPNQQSAALALNMTLADDDIINEKAD